MNKIIPVAVAIIHKDSKFLLTERKNNDPEDGQFGRIWHFPGGAIEYGEEVHEALKREIKEELSLEIAVIQQLPKIYSTVRNHWQGLLIPHLCRIVGNETIALDDESFQYGWFSYEEATKLYSLPFVTEMLDEAQNLLKKREINMLKGL